MSSSKNLRDCQKSIHQTFQINQYFIFVVVEAVINMLHFNVSNKDETDGVSTWKILVLDAVGQRILSPLLKVSELRDHGVTLYL